MNVQDYLDALPMGEAVCNRRVLAAMKRKGLISDYSQWGYLESHKVYYISDWRGEPATDYSFIELSAEPKDGELGSYVKPYPSGEAMWKALHKSGFHYRGHYFTTRYFDGCFKPYLVKAACA